jgi:succinyl-CoA synthetase beta subunit
MKIHEFQAKELLAPLRRRRARGPRVQDARRGRAGATRRSQRRGVVKAQIHAGGRGKGGRRQAREARAEERAPRPRMLGNEARTHQTAPRGRSCAACGSRQGSHIDSELYVGIAIDRERSCRC